MINNRTYIFYDMETGGLNTDRCQILSLSAVAIDPRKLCIIPDSEFNAFIKPLDDDEAIKKGYDPISKSALAVNKIVLADLVECPDEETVFRNFRDYVNQWNVKKDSWNSPLGIGFNNNGFDIKLINRLCQKYGCWDEKRNQQKLFNPVQSLDLKDITWMFNENNPEIENNNFDSVRAWLGLTNDGAHSSIVDVRQGAETFCRFQKLIRYWASKTNFKGN